MGVIKDRVRKLRRNQTLAEEYFWEEARSNKLGLSFRRQYPLVFYAGKERNLFIADFCCKKHKLIVEIDGKIHENQKDYDNARTLVINQLGYQVIRFTNEQVLNNFSEVIEVLSPLAGKGGRD